MLTPQRRQNPTDQKKPCNPHKQTQALIPRVLAGERSLPCSAALVTLPKGPSTASSSFKRPQSRDWALRLAQHLVSPHRPATCLPVHPPFSTLCTTIPLTGF